MKIAIPTNDKKQITKRTGQAKWFAVFEVSDGKAVNIEYRANEHEHHDHEDEEHEHSHGELVEILKDCDMVLLLMIGKHLKQDFEDANISFTKVKGEIILDVLEDYIA